jgi:ABC-2 type transport system permease protein
MIPIIRFDLARHLRAMSTYIYFLILAGIAFLLMITAGGAFQSASVVMGGGKVFINSPYSLAQITSLLSYFGLLIISAISGKAAFQDFESNTHSFFFTMPIRKSSYLGGRFLGAMLILIAIFSGIALGLAIATKMPFLDKVRIGPNHLLAYVQPFLVSVVPNLFVMGALFFSLAALTRRIAPVYMTSVILLVGYLIATSISSKLEDKFAAALLDPFGARAMDRVTQYWTIAEKNTRLVPLEGALLWNRLLWIGVAVALLAFTYFRFKFVYAIEGRRASAPRGLAHAVATADAEVSPGTIVDTIRATPYVTPQFSTALSIRALARLTRLGFTETVKNIYFAVIVLAGVLFMIFAARTSGDIYGTPTYPVTYQILDLVGGSFQLFILIIITFYSGELVWRERDARTHELVDTLPLPNWTLFLSKLCALSLVMVLLNVVVMIAGMAIQLSKGYTHLEPLLYIKELFGLNLIGYWLLCVLAITVQALVNNKYMGFFVMVLYYLSTAFMGQLGFEHHLYQYDSDPGYTYSDMNRFGHFLAPIFWFDAYWIAFAVLLAILGYLFFVRGLATEWGWRSYLAHRRLGAPQRAIAGVALAAFLALGGFIFYNTNVLNIYRGDSSAAHHVRKI